MLWLGTNHKVQQLPQKYSLTYKTSLHLAWHMWCFQESQSSKFENSWDSHSKWFCSMQFWRWLNSSSHIWKKQKFHNIMWIFPHFTYFNTSITLTKKFTFAQFFYPPKTSILHITWEGLCNMENRVPHQGFQISIKKSKSTFCLLLKP
jgi:hypothetical protein